MTGTSWSVGSAVPAGWDALLRSDPNATAAHRPELWRAFEQTLPGYEARVHAVRDDAGALLGGCAALLQRRAGLHFLHALPMLLPAAPLARDGAHARVDAECGRAFASLQREVHATGGEWSLYRPHGPTVELGSVGAPDGVTRTFEAAVVELGDGLDAALRRVDRKTRQTLARARARGLAFDEAPGDLAAAYALYAKQARGWRAHRPLPLELSRRLLAAAPECGIADPVARLFAVRDGRGLLSAVLALDHPRETFVWWSGTHAEGRARQAFTVLLWGVVEWAAARGRERVNLGASAGREAVSSFKDSLGAALVRYPVRWLDARHAPLAGRLAGALQERLRSGRARGEAT